MTDVFVKNAKEISFCSNQDKISLSEKVTIGTAISGIIYLTGKMAASQNPEHIFLSDGTYLGHVDDFKVESDEMHIDLKKGIFKIEGTGIDIDANNYDISDPEKGIFKNYDGSVDIDIPNNKIIDVENGVFIDPEQKLSVILNNGQLENIVIPNFSSDINFEGASLSGWWNPTHRLTRGEYIEKYGETPEENLSHIYDEGRNRIVNDVRDRVADPDDNRTAFQKIMDFINPMTPDSKLNNLYDKTKQYDVFGREIMTIKDADGNISKIALDENLSEIVSKYKLNENSIGELSEFFEKIKLNEYILESHTGYSDIFTYPYISLEEFLSNLTETNGDVATIIAQDTIAENMDTVSEHAHTFIDSIKEMYNNLF